MNKRSLLIIGIDLSVNHWAYCQIDYITGKCVYHWYMTDKKYEYEKNVMNAILLSGQDKKGGESKENYEERRRMFSIHSLIQPIYGYNGSMYVALEGYAFGAVSRGSCQIAELTGCVKSALYSNKCYVRIHDPLSVKLYSTGKGNCLKKDIILKAKELGFNISESLIKKETKKVRGRKLLHTDPNLPDLIRDKKVMVVKQSRTASEEYYIKEEIEEYAGIATDLADAFFLARMLRTELMLRSGEEDLKDLPENERRIFLRVTKALPENVLSRPFIYKE